MNYFSHDPSSKDNRQPLLAVAAILAALAMALTMFFSLGAQPAAAQEEATDEQATEGASSEENAEADKNAIIQRSPSALNFGSVKTGSSGDATVTVTGVSQGCLVTFFSTCVSPLFSGSIGDASISGPNAGNFSIVDNSCKAGGTATTLDPGQSCSIKVRFNPNNAQSYNATLNIPPHENGHTSFSGSSSVALSGVGSTPPPPPPPPNEPPVVISTSPTGSKVKSSANVTADFSESMDSGSINTGTFTLTRRGSSTPVTAVVTYDSATKKATLNPSGKLKRGATYTARITTGAKDLLGASLDQDPVNPGNQDKTFTFKVKR